MWKIVEAKRVKQRKQLVKKKTENIARVDGKTMRTPFKTSHEVRGKKHFEPSITYYPNRQKAEKLNAT